ncbi:PRP38 family protein [Histomonas meleagridis]|uniref:PRP38 family protein n=1 Tax=Histomonas meleagridis TaxID=135588 RepID=UPI00355A3C1C|nr:PRP38 family protein [Histomonas meleagridis]
MRERKSKYVHPSWSPIQNYKKSVRGTAPQHLLDPKTRHKIYNSVYWLQYCFGVNLVVFVDRAQMIKGVGGLYGHLKLPCEFLCLFLKLLELEPSRDIILYFLNTRCWQMKHLRLLAALYVRFTFPPEEVYIVLEPLLMQYNQVAILRDDEFQITHFDEIIHSFIHDEFWCGVSLPPLTPRVGLPPRHSPLNHLNEALREEVFFFFLMAPDGQLFEEIEEKKKLKLKGKLKFKSKKKHKKEKPVIVDEIAEENRIRALLGLKPLK